MKQREKCIRTCAGCRTKSKKDALIRIVKTPKGKIFIDTTHKAQGRGCYLCKNIKCIETAQKRRSLNRCLRTNIDNAIYDNLKEEIIN